MPTLTMKINDKPVTVEFDFYGDCYSVNKITDSNGVEINLDDVNVYDIDDAIDKWNTNQEWSSCGPLY